MSAPPFILVYWQSVGLHIKIQCCRPGRGQVKAVGCKNQKKVLEKGCQQSVFLRVLALKIWPLIPPPPGTH